MKKGLVFVIVISAFMNLTLYAGTWDWLSKKVSDNSKRLNANVEKSIEKINKIPSKILAKLNRHKLKLLEIQKKIKNQIILLSNNPEDAGALKKMQELTDELRIEENEIMAESKGKMDSIDFARLKTALDNQIKLIKQEIKESYISEKLIDIWKKYSTPEFKKQVIAKNPPKSSQAQVTRNETLSSDENLFRKRRMSSVKKGLNKFFNKQITKPLTIAFAGSGGGYRAMISTVGYLKGMEDIGLLDASTYVAGLSGSSWCIAPWISMGGTMHAFKQTLLEKIRNNRFDIKKVQTALKGDVKVLVNDIIWPKFLFDQPIGSIDLYGALLTKILLADFGEKRHKMQLSEQWSMIQDGSKPFPLYTAISMHKLENSKYLYNWYEFNPLEVRNLELGLSIPTYSFNSIFKAGVAKEVAPEQSLGYLMGIFGSVYTMNLKDLRANYFSAVQEEEKKQSAFEKVKYAAVTKIVNLIEDSSLGTMRASPAQVNNPFQGITNYAIPGWLKNREYITLIDAGLDYNVPVRSLLLPERHIDVIIIADASSDSAEAAVLKKVFDDAKRVHNYDYVRVDDGNNKTFFLYKDPHNNHAPRIIYINFVHDAQVMQQAQNDSALKKIIDQYDLASFDVIECMEKGSCGTFNFNYSEKDFLQLSGMAEFNIKVNKKAIQDFITQEFFAAGS